MTPDELLALFAEAAGAQREVLLGLTGAGRREPTSRPGQYALDLVADKAVLEVLHRVGVAVISEESGRTGLDSAPVTVVVDPVDGSTNCSRDIPYWAISLCALDAEGPLCSLVANQATGAQVTAVRDEGAWRDGEPLSASDVRRVEDAVVSLSGFPHRPVRWHQFRALGSAALELCDVAAGALDGFLAAGSSLAPWDYLGGLLACQEAGALIVDVRGRDLVVTDPGERRQVLAAGTPELLEALRPAITP